MKKTVYFILLVMLLSLAVPALGAELPDWYPADPANFERFHDPNAPRVVDNADILTDAEEHTVETLISGLREKFGCDFVFYSDVTTYGLGEEVWAADFYDFNGYGVGPEYNGCLLFVCMDPTNRCWWTCATGETQSLFTFDAINRVDNKLQPYMVSGNYGAGIIDYYDSMKTLFRTGHGPRTADDYFLPAVISVIIGFLAAFIARGILKGKMKTVEEKRQAGAYQVPGSVVLRSSQDIFLRKTVNRTKRVTEQRTSGGGGGGSSFSGGYHGSSGVSHTGGGRKF